MLESIGAAAWKVFNPAVVTNVSPETRCTFRGGRLLNRLYGHNVMLHLYLIVPQAKGLDPLSRHSLFSANLVIAAITAKAVPQQPQQHTAARPPLALCGKCDASYLMTE